MVKENAWLKSVTFDSADFQDVHSERYSISMPENLPLLKINDLDPGEYNLKITIEEALQGIIAKPVLVFYLCDKSGDSKYSLEFDHDVQMMLQLIARKLEFLRAPSEDQMTPDQKTAFEKAVSDSETAYKLQKQAFITKLENWIDTNNPANEELLGNIFDLVMSGFLDKYIKLTSEPGQDGSPPRIN